MSDAAASRAFDAVLFDFGGVLIGSPFTALESLATELNLPVPFEVFMDLVFGPYHEDTDHPWHRMERGELVFADYFTYLAGEAAHHGIDLDLATFASAFAEPVVHHHMVDLVQELRAAGFRLAMVTNNIAEGRRQWERIVPPGAFDVIIDSSEVGMRKPDERIYHLALDRLGGVAPERAIFLDDAPGNIEGARRAGLEAVLVTADTGAAEAELRALVGL